MAVLILYPLLLGFPASPGGFRIELTQTISLVTDAEIAGPPDTLVMVAAGGALPVEECILEHKGLDGFRVDVCCLLGVAGLKGGIILKREDMNNNGHWSPTCEFYGPGAAHIVAHSSVFRSEFSSDSSYGYVLTCSPAEATIDQLFMLVMEW